MPNKKAQRNNNRKTKRAPPKGVLHTELDIEMKGLVRGMNLCGERDNCEVCRVAKARVNILIKFKKLGATKRSQICCFNPECQTNRDTQILLGSRFTSYGV